MPGPCYLLAFALISHECVDRWNRCAGEAAAKCPPLSDTAWSDEDRWWAHQCRSTCGICRQTALDQSFGFFNESDSAWHERRVAHDSIRRQQEPLRGLGPLHNHTHTLARAWPGVHVPNEYLRLAAANRAFYASRWHPSFHCAHAMHVGASSYGGKWVCDVWRIRRQPRCLVYSIGSNNNFEFERGVHALLPACEIHTFDHTIGPSPSNKPHFVNFHQVGLAAQISSNPQLRTLPQIVADLGHRGREVELFKIDCESCEVATLSSWFEADVPLLRQILVETHLRAVTAPSWPQPHVLEEFFKKLVAHGYVVFSKELNMAGVDQVEQCCAEFSLIRLHRGFSVLSL